MGPLSFQFIRVAQVYVTATVPSLKQVLKRTIGIVASMELNNSVHEYGIMLCGAPAPCPPAVPLLPYGPPLTPNYPHAHSRATNPNS